MQNGVFLAGKPTLSNLLSTNETKVFHFQNVLIIFAQEKLLTMKMYSIAANDVRKLLDKANELGIEKEQIVEVVKTNDGVFQMIYFAED